MFILELLILTIAFKFNNCLLFLQYFRKSDIAKPIESNYLKFLKILKNCWQILKSIFVEVEFLQIFKAADWTQVRELAVAVLDSGLQLRDFVVF